MTGKPLISIFWPKFLIKNYNNKTKLCLVKAFCHISVSMEFSKVKIDVVLS